MSLLPLTDLRMERHLIAASPRTVKFHNPISWLYSRGSKSTNKHSEGPILA